MNYSKKKLEVAFLIKQFLNRRKTINELQEYSWKIISEYSLKKQTETMIDPDGSIFWFAVWQIQHLSDKEHLEDGTLERDLEKTLKYLLNQDPIPPGIYGIPPLIDK